eukprot:evm.model.NODE_34345_length_10564_cov_17.839739.1
MITGKKPEGAALGGEEGRDGCENVNGCEKEGDDNARETLCGSFQGEEEEWVRATFMERRAEDLFAVRGEEVEERVLEGCPPSLLMLALQCVGQEGEDRPTAREAWEWADALWKEMKEEEGGREGGVRVLEGGRSPSEGAEEEGSEEGGEWEEVDLEAKGVGNDMRDRVREVDGSGSNGDRKQRRAERRRKKKRRHQQQQRQRQQQQQQQQQQLQHQQQHQEEEEEEEEGKSAAAPWVLNHPSSPSSDTTIHASTTMPWPPYSTASPCRPSTPLLLLLVLTSSNPPPLAPAT